MNPKQAIIREELVVTNLTPTSDNSLVSKSEKSIESNKIKHTQYTHENKASNVVILHILK